MNSILRYLLFLVCINTYSIKNATAQISPEGFHKIEESFPLIDRLFKEYAAKNHFPGFVYGLIIDGKLIHTANTGYTDLEKPITANSQSAFRIASMTKSFTAMAILQLRDEGKLKLDDPAYRYIPELKGLHYPTIDAADITIRNLLTHGAGFPEDNPWGDRQLSLTDEEMMKMIRKGISFSNDPGISYEYSNMGFAMLGYVIKKVTGKTYEQYITEHILTPLGMTHTYWEYTNVPEGKLAFGYRWQNNKWVKQPLLHDGAYGAMGGMITTIEDFSKYVELHLSAWPPSNAKETGPVKRSSIREMQHPWNFSTLNAQYKYPSGRACPIVSAYCYGLRWSKDCDGRVTIGHSGGLPGFGSNWTILPDYGIGVIAFSNLTYAPASTFNVQVLDTLISLAKLQPRQIPVSSILNQRKNELLGLLPDFKNAQAGGIFSVNFFMDYSIDSLKKEADKIFTNAGTIIRVRELVPENNLRGSFILECEKALIVVSFTLTPENPPLIQEYHIWQLRKQEGL